MLVSGCEVNDVVVVVLLLLFFGQLGSVVGNTEWSGFVAFLSMSFCRTGLWKHEIPPRFFVLVFAFLLLIRAMHIRT